MAREIPAAWPQRLSLNSVCMCVRVYVCQRACVHVSVSIAGGRGLIFDDKFVYANIVCRFVFAFLTRV